MYGELSVFVDAAGQECVQGFPGPRGCRFNAEYGSYFSLERIKGPGAP